MNIYVGNLPFDLSEDELKAHFAPYGNVISAKIINDKFTGKSRGFGFVEMSDNNEGTAAIAGLNGKELKGRPLRVNESQPKPGGGGGGPRRSGGPGGGRGGAPRY